MEVGTLLKQIRYIRMKVLIPQYLSTIYLETDVNYNGYRFEDTFELCFAFPANRVVSFKHLDRGVLL